VFIFHGHFVGRGDFLPVERGTTVLCQGASVLCHISLSLINSLIKTEDVIFLMHSMHSEDFLFVSQLYTFTAISKDELLHNRFID